MAITRFTSLLFLLIALTINPLLISCKYNAVVDVHGKPLLSKNTYYINPPKSIYLGGVSPGDRGRIVQLHTTSDVGVPVGFTPKPGKNINGVINESSNLIIQFHHEDGSKSQWKLIDEKEKETGNYYLSMFEGTTNGSFQIVKSKNKYSYNIIYCLGKSCKPVELFDYNHDRFLVLNDKVPHSPLDFVFLKA
ncbi:hypothetical protein ACFE04_007441 [Oxalis oulophora]